MFNIPNDAKTLVLIDGANMHATTKALGFDVDFKLFHDKINESCNLLRICYYTALLEDNERIILKPLVDWLAYNNYTVITKPAKVMINSAGERKIKGNMDVEIAVDALMMAVAPYSFDIGNIVLCTGDGDFCSLVRALQGCGIRITIVSSVKTQPAMCADELRKQADSFIDLGELQGLIQKTSFHALDTEERKPIAKNPD